MTDQPGTSAEINKKYVSPLFVLYVVPGPALIVGLL